MVELLSGLPLFIQQFKALFKKNIILSWRNRVSTFLQIFSSIFFIFLIFIVDKAIRSRFNSSYYDDIIDPKPLVFPPIPPCEDKFFIKKPCFDFAWSGSRNTKFSTIVKRIRMNNPGRVIPAKKVRHFRTPAEVDNWLFHNPMRCPGVLHFVERNASVISYGIQTNSTIVTKRGLFEDPTLKFQIPLQVAAEREIARFFIGDPSFSWTMAFKEFAHPAEDTFSSVGTMGPTFFLAIAMFGFIFQIGALVAEKELKLRQAMSIMGLYDTSYWLSWLIWEALIGFLSSLFTVLFGMLFQFDFFLHNDFVVLFLVFFLFQINMIGFAFMISSFISKASSSTTVGFSIFIVGFLTQLVTSFGFPYAADYKKLYKIIWSFFPPNLLAKALDLLGKETATPQSPGISWHGHSKCPESELDCVITIGGIYNWLGGTFLLWFILALYFDNIIPNPYGVRKSLFYFLNPGYWTGSGGGKVREGGIFSCCGSLPTPENITPDDEDVLEEENIVKKQAMEGYTDPNLAVQIRGLVKTYPGTTNIGCCKCTKTAPFHAVKGLWIHFPKDQLFCLLGPNGAGKTTAINSLTGITPVTAGDALIYGFSVRSSVGMANIRRIIGVCPQFDILWDALSGKEHLHLFASIKGLPPSSIEKIAENSLSEVKLQEAAKMRAGSYSGGMKRRLSVAIALIGDPKLVILDEPTTGMDPITRRHVWDIIENAKKGRAIVLTTHSMEEADILGFIANVSFTGNNPGQTPDRNNAQDTTTSNNQSHDSVKYFFKQHLNVEPKEETMTFLTFVIPHEKEELLTNFFAELQDREKEFGISDIQLGLTTLEEVFLNIAKKAELEIAIQEGILVTLTLTSGEDIEIPKGARFIGIPGTETAENPKGVMVEVYWGQDEDGVLCIAGHSPQTPIPPNVQLSASPTSNSEARQSGNSRFVRGFVIDPKEIEG